MNPKIYIRHSLVQITLVALCVAFAISCNEEYQFTHGNIYGVVTDATTGLPIYNCNISIANDNGSITDRQVSGNDGTYKTKDLSEGEYTISIEKEDYYADASKKVEVKAGETTQCDIMLSRIPARITADTERLDFGYDASLSTLSFKIINKYLDDLEWVTEYDCDWISSISPTDGTLSHGKTETIVVKIDRTKLPEGDNQTNIVVKSRNGQGGVNITVNATGENREAPVLNVTNVSDVETTKAVLWGEIVKPGVPEYTRRGFTCSLASNDDEAEEFLAEYNDNAIFSYDVSGLLPGKTYYVRAFAVNESAGKVWSANEISFATIKSKTVVQTLEVSDVDVASGKATFNGIISEAGDPVYSERGFCFGVLPEPTVSDTKVAVSGGDAGQYSYVCASLSQNTTYYVRAYAIQYGRVVYGTSVTFNTNVSTTLVTTSTATNVTSSSATLNGSILEIGSPPYSEKGFCYSTAPNPDITDIKIIVAGGTAGDYSADISGLSFNTKYYYVAYAIQDGEVIYGPETSFTSTCTEALVETYSAVSDVEYNSAKLSFKILDIGDPKCTEAGICYGQSSSPTISSGVVSGSLSTLKQTLTISGLEENTTYFYRAYVKQGGKELYGSVFSFKTATRPSVSTLDVSDLQNPYGLMNMWQVQLNATVTSIGDPGISKRGFKYSSNGDPEGNGTIVAVSGSSAGNYSVAVSGLKSNTTYYVRAFVVNSIGYEYGGLITFTTGD